MFRLSGLVFATVVCLLLPSDAVAKKFVLTGEIQCASPKTGESAVLKSMEISEGKNTQLKQKVTLDTSKFPVKYRIEGEGEGQGASEPVFKLVHNCTPDGAETTQLIELMGGEEKNSVYYLKQNLNAKKARNGGKGRRFYHHRKNIDKMNPKLIAKDEPKEKINYACPCLHKICSYNCMTK